MSKYIGCKMVAAEPCKAWKDMGTHKVGEDGYKVIYPDGYVSWSPKEVFEKAYMQVGDNNTVTQELVDKFIKDVHVETVDNKTTVVVVELINCLGRIKNKLWELLGFMLQTALKGLK